MLMDFSAEWLVGIFVSAEDIFQTVTQFRRSDHVGLVGCGLRRLGQTLEFSHSEELASCMNDGNGVERELGMGDFIAVAQVCGLQAIEKFADRCSAVFESDEIRCNHVGRRGERCA